MITWENCSLFINGTEISEIKYCVINGIKINLSKLKVEKINYTSEFLKIILNKSNYN